MGRIKELFIQQRSLELTFQSALDKLEQANQIKAHKATLLREALDYKEGKYKICEKDGIYWKETAKVKAKIILASFNTYDERDQFIKYFNINTV